MKDKNGIELHGGSPVEVCAPKTETREAIHVHGVVMGEDKGGIMVAYTHIHVGCFEEINLTSCEPLPPVPPAPVPEPEKPEHHKPTHHKHK